MSDLNYNINATVTGGEEVHALAEDINDISETPNVNVDASGAASQIDAVTTSVEGLDTPLADINTKSGTWKDTLGTLAAGAILVGEAVDILGQIVGPVTELWHRYNAENELTDQISSQVAESLAGVTGVLETQSERLRALIENARTAGDLFGAAFTDQLDHDALVDFNSTLETLGLNLEDAGTAMLDFQSNEVATMQRVLEDAGVPTQMAAAFAEAGASTDSYGEILNNVAREHGDHFATMLQDDYGPLLQAAGALEDSAEHSREAFADFFDEVELGGGAAAEALEAIRDANPDVDPDSREIFQQWAEDFLAVRDNAQEADAAVAGLTDNQVDIDTSQAAQNLQDLQGKVDEFQASFDSNKRLGAKLTKITIEADTEPATTAIEGVTSAEHATTVDVQADTEQAVTDIDAATASRVLSVLLSLVNGAEFDEVIDGHTADRTIQTDLVTRTVDVPSAGQLLSLATNGQGRIVVPFQGRWNSRMEGRRPI